MTNILIFGEAIDTMRQRSPKDELHIQDFLAANCFGDYYTRDGIDLKTRELLTFAMLISLGGCDPQVKGHVTGNLKVGNDRTRLIDVVTQLLPYIGYPRSLNALRAIDEVVPPTNITNAPVAAH
jgi:4-carboxymuconolactone decarboxylase